MAGALDGICILEVSHLLAGPYCTTILSDMGASVIKVEEPKTGDPMRKLGTVFIGEDTASFFSLNRNKKSLTLNLQSEKGREILLHLAEHCDVFVENWRPGVVDRMGIGYDSLSKVNPGIIYCSISAFGQNGPHCQKTGVDPIIQAMSGIMGITGEANGRPVPVGCPIADTSSALTAAYGIAVALFARERTGVGQKIDIALMDSLMSLLAPRESEYFVTGKPLQPMGSVHRQIAPYQTFATRDHYIYIAVINEKQWSALCRVLGLEHLLKDPRFESNAMRVKHKEELATIIEPVLKEKTANEWLDKLEPEGVICSLIYDFQQLFSDPHVQHRQMVVQLNHPQAGLYRVMGTPVKLSRTPGGPREAGPLLGQHTEEILSNLLNLSAKEIKSLRNQGII